MPGLKKDEDLDHLEEDIRILKNKYDQFFAGIAKVPPMHDRRNVEIRIYEMSKGKMRDNARRFRFNTLLTRFNQYREMWARKMREREEGPLDFRRRQSAMQGEGTLHQEGIAIPRVTPAAIDPYVRIETSGNGDGVRQLFEKIENESRRVGKTAPVTLEQLSSMIRQQSEKFRQRYNVGAVAFRVDTVEGKVVIKAKPIQE